MPWLHHYWQIREYPDSTISKILTVLKWQMIMTLNRKLLEKLCFLWGTHRSLFYNVNATVSFWNRLTQSIFRFKNLSLERQTDRQTDKTDCLTPSHIHVWGNQYWRNLEVRSTSVKVYDALVACDGVNRLPEAAMHLSEICSSFCM